MIHYIISPKWESFQNFLAGMLNLSLGFISAKGELVSLFNPRPPYAGLAYSPERDAAFNDFFVQASHAVTGAGEVRLLHDPSGMPVAVALIADNLLLFLTGGFGAPKDPLLTAKAECVAALYLHIFQSLQQGVAHSTVDGATLFASVDKLCRLAETLFSAGETHLPRIFNLIAHLLIIFCDAEAAFILNRYHKAGQFVYQGMHEDMQIILRRQWEQANIDEPDFLAKWDGVRKFGHLGLQLHFAASTGRKGPFCLGVVNPQSGHSRGNLDTFIKQTIIIAEASLFTEHRLLEEEILHTSKLESIATLAGGIAHDYNNFLATMLANISLAKLCRGDWEKVLAKLTSMETAILQAKELTRQLFVFAGDSDSVKQTVGIRKLIIGSTDFALSGTNVSPEYDLAEDLLPVEIDRGQINQIISNIVINAVQAMPQGGIISVKATNIVLDGDEERDGGIIPLPPGQYVMLSFTDGGTGIADANLPKIFEPFFSTKEKGRGLGLATARTIMQRHNGHIDVKSKINKGTTFTLYLPAAGGMAQNGNKEEKIIKGRGRILLMDDKAEIGKAAGEMLSYLGYAVTFAGNGAAAIDAYKDALRAGRPFDLVIIDLTVPGGMGGQAVLKELLTVDPKVKAILASGYANDHTMENYRAYGFKGAIVKPFKMEELSQIVHRCLCLEARSQEPESRIEKV